MGENKHATRSEGSEISGFECGKDALEIGQDKSRNLIRSVFEKG